MKQYVNTFTFLVISLCCCITVEQMFNPPTYALFDICGQTISISEDMILRPTFNDSSKPPHHCEISIESDVFGNRLLIQVLDMDIPYSAGCNQTSIHITGTEGNKHNGILCGSNISTNVFNTTGQSVHVLYRSKGRAEDISNVSFSLLISSFHTQTDGSCDSYEFVCTNKLCIDDDLACNGYNDCSDNSDETIGCQKHSGNHILEIVTLSIVGGIFFITVTVVCYVKIRRARATGGKYLPIS